MQKKEIIYLKFGEVSYLAISWEELSELTFAVARQILADKRQIDQVVTLAKGGWPMARSLVDFLRIAEVASVGVKFYAGVNERMEKPQVYQELPSILAGKRILLFDDVADTGESLLFVKDYLNKLGVAEVVTATLFYKPKSKLRPDYFGQETEAWIVFPYEVREHIQILRAFWEKENLSEEVFKNRLLQLGFKKEWVDFFEMKKDAHES